MNILETTNTTVPISKSNAPISQECTSIYYSCVYYMFAHFSNGDNYSLLLATIQDDVILFSITHTHIHTFTHILLQLACLLHKNVLSFVVASVLVIRF